MAHLKNDDKIVDIFVDKMFASRWDEGKGLRRRPASPLASVLAVLKHHGNRDRNDGFADRAYMARYADCPDALEAHLASRGPEWAAAITGLPAEQIEDFARLYCGTERSYIRLGYGFSCRVCPLRQHCFVRLCVSR